MVLELKVEERKERGKDNKALREKGMVPGVFYGAKQESTPIAFSAKDWKKVFKEAGETTVINLIGSGEDHEVLVHEVDLDPVTNEALHVDFYAFEKGQELEVAVPIEFVGTPALVKSGAANLVKVLHEITVKARPSKLPKQIEANVEGLAEFDAALHVSDITFPEGVTPLAEPTEVVAILAEAKEEVIETEAATVDMAAIEVEQKGKVEEEGAEGAAAEAKE